MEANRTERGAARRRALIEAASEMFLDQGYESVSLDTLIARVGGSRRNIYGPFGGKEGLFIEVVTQLCADLSRPLEELDIDAEHDVSSALTLFGCRVLSIVLQPRTLALQRLMIGEGLRFPELAQAIWHAGHDNAVRRLSVWIGRKQVADQLRGDISPSDLAAQFVNLLVTGPQLRALVGIASKPLDDLEITRLTKIAVKAFLEGALVKDTKRNA
ncbi:TetR/AcrR family transcriptional regulator [Mesorhizobium sp. DCY119]|uniref:TetR/AcrR family transcriptional regulator n=1 Tax=Mesorhizobium sp. DCY119 TaxID=2108445 RepID=UPI000E6BC3DA|nr:TetR/AcrR family transcriptional regulator [Mesorhizobium sp. DCY119]RJG46119.1 TetR/AcrR family transcriptional regulator [Mesorhizobium sp. DCY119]